MPLIARSWTLSCWNIPALIAAKPTSSSSTSITCIPRTSSQLSEGSSTRTARSSYCARSRSAKSAAATAIDVGPHCNSAGRAFGSRPMPDLRWCWACKTMKPSAAFAFRDIKRRLPQGHCRLCHAALRRQHYIKNKSDYVRRAIAQVKRRRDENRKQLYRYLSSHPCVDCGETDIVVLEFDHRLPAEKVRDVSGLAARRVWASVLKEIEKCDVRCVNCHRRRTARQFNWPGRSPD